MVDLIDFLFSSNETEDNFEFYVPLFQKGDPVKYNLRPNSQVIFSDGLAEATWYKVAASKWNKNDALVVTMYRWDEMSINYFFVEYMKELDKTFIRVSENLDFIVSNLPFPITENLANFKSTNQRNVRSANMLFNALRNETAESKYVSNLQNIEDIEITMHVLKTQLGSVQHLNSSIKVLEAFHFKRILTANSENIDLKLLINRAHEMFYLKFIEKGVYFDLVTNNLHKINDVSIYYEVLIFSTFMFIAKNIGYSEESEEKKLKMAFQVNQSKLLFRVLFPASPDFLQHIEIYNYILALEQTQLNCQLLELLKIVDIQVILMHFILKFKLNSKLIIRVEGGNYTLEYAIAITELGEKCTMLNTIDISEESLLAYYNNKFKQNKKPVFGCKKKTTDGAKVYEYENDDEMEIIDYDALKEEKVENDKEKFKQLKNIMTKTKNDLQSYSIKRS